MLNKNIPFNIDFRNQKYDEICSSLLIIIKDQKKSILKISNFVILAKKALKISADDIKIGLVVLSKRNPGTIYLERISEPYIDNRRHYVLYDGFVRNRILIKEIGKDGL